MESEENMDALRMSIRKLRDASARQYERVQVLGKAAENLLATTLRPDQRTSEGPNP